MKIALTGADGFLGWHTRLRLHAHGQDDVVPVTRATWNDLAAQLSDCEAVIHLAGVNRGADTDVEEKNIELAEQLVTAVRAQGAPMRVVYSNSIHAGASTPYGIGKARAGELIRTLADEGHTVVDIRLPNIFGEHGRPHYNSFVATFAHAVANQHPVELIDREVELLHAQSAADALIVGLTTSEEYISPSGSHVFVREVLDLLEEFESSYRFGEFPALTSRFRIDLLNTYRAALFPQRYPIPLRPQTDPRGTFVETVRSRGGESQSSVSTTYPGVTRGEHYHLSKIERFVVVHGSARIALRRMFHDRVIEFDVTGEQPCAVDMPMGWVHNITNTGSDLLITQFWAHELFRPDAPDTFAQPVALESPA